MTDHSLRIELTAKDQRIAELEKEKSRFWKDKYDAESEAMELTKKVKALEEELDATKQELFMVKENYERLAQRYDALSTEKFIDKLPKPYFHLLILFCWVVFSGFILWTTLRLIN